MTIRVDSGSRRQPPHLHGISWRRALAGLAAPALRMHHYRDLRTAMLREALSELDCPAGECADNE